MTWINTGLLDRMYRFLRNVGRDSQRGELSGSEFERKRCDPAPEVNSLLGGDMKMALLGLFGAVSGFIALASAELPTPGGPPSLEFHTIPIEGAPISEHKVTPYRLFDKMIVTVWDPVACGQKPTNPAFSIQGDKLFLSYALSSAPPEAKRCTLISEFDVLNVPHRDLEINFAGGPEPYVVATLKKCPYYKPASDDIWECLAPAKP